MAVVHVRPPGQLYRPTCGARRALGYDLLDHCLSPLVVRCSILSGSMAVLLDLAMAVVHVRPSGRLYRPTCGARKGILTCYLRFFELHPCVTLLPSWGHRH
jgi:hypothetical protein